MGNRIRKCQGYVAAIVVAAIMGGCVKIVSPVMPSWDVSLTMPLINRTYSISQLVEKDTSLLRAGAGNELSVVTVSDMRPTLMGNNLVLPSREVTTSMKLGPFNVSMPTLVSPIIVPGLPRGLRVPIPDTTVAAPVLFDTVSTFESITLVNGTMTLTLRNNLPVSVDVVAPIYMIDDVNSIVAIFEFNPATIPSNSSRSAQSDLASKTIGSPQVVGNILSISGIGLHIHGSAVPVQVPAGDMMIATITATGLKARHAVNIFLPSQRLVDSDSSHVLLSDSTLIQDLMIKSGTISMMMRSTVDVDMTFRYRFKELYTQVNGALVSYEDSVFLQRRGSAARSVNVAAYRIRSSAGTLLSSLEALGTVIIPIAGNQPISLNDTDKVSIELTYPAPVVVDSAVGVVQPTWVNVSTLVPLGLKHIPAGLKAQFDLPSASLSLGTQSGIGFPADAYLKLAARRGQGDTVSLQIPPGQRRVEPGRGIIRFDEGTVGRFLSEISYDLPDSILIAGSVLVNPQDVYNPSLSGVGRVGCRSGLSGQMELRIPLTVGISNGSYCDTVALGDTSGSGGGFSIPGKSHLNSVNNGRLHVEVRNGTGLQVDMKLGILDAGKQHLLSLPKPGQSIHIAAAQVDGQGNATVPARNDIVLELTGGDVQQFVPAEFLAYSISFVPPAGGPAVRIKTTDGVSIRIWLDLSYRMK